MSKLWARISTGVTFLALVILFIPLAFDVGGRDCGLTYSLSLAVFYFLLSSARLAVPTSKSWRGARVLLSSIELLQYTVVIPGLLIYALSKFSDDEEGGGRTPRERSTGLEGGHGADRTPVGKLTIGPWDTFLTFSTPMFQLSEGFCSLLVIQAGGQISRWLVNRKRSDTWMITLLVMSGSIISSSLYFLWRITTFPEIGNLDATLIGVSVTCAIFLCAYGIKSGRGNPIESSLLFSYIVLCVYQIFTDYKPSTPPPATIEKAEFPPFPPMIMTSYESLVSSLSAFLPSFLQQIGTFVISAYSTITPSVIISLAYRLFVFYASTRIIPAVRQSGGGRELHQEPSVRDREVMSRIAGFFGWYSPCILIAVYTHLLLQHFEVIGGNGLAAGWITGVPVGGHVWRWVNIGATSKIPHHCLWRIQKLTSFYSATLCV